MLAISTPAASDNNYYGRLMEVQDPDTGESMFKTIRVGTACADCVRAGTAVDCTHLQSRNPSWKSNQRLTRVRRIMAEVAQDSNLHLRENMGMVASGTQYIFTSPDVSKFLQPQRRFAWTRPPPVVYSAVDPSGGGTQSSYAVCTTSRDEMGVHALVGIDSSDAVRSEEVAAMLYDHFKALRTNAHYQRSVLVLIVEANMSNIEVDRVLGVAQRPEFEPVYVVRRVRRASTYLPGVTTTEANKRAYVSRLENLLGDGQLRVARELVSAAPDRHLQTLGNQLRMFRRVVKPQRTPEFATARSALTGKGLGQKDDLIMALMMSLYFGFYTRRTERFQAFCRQNNVYVAT